jgi:phage gp16-like protein
MKDARSRELAQIHMAQAALGLDDATYRDALWTVARVRSAADLDAHGRRAVIAHFKARGWAPRGIGRPRPAATRRPLLGKVFALLGERPVAYAEAILKHMFGDAAPARLEWADSEQLRKLVAALSYDATRRRARARPATAPAGDESACN